MSGHDIPLDEIGIDSSESVPYDSFDSAPNSPHVHLGGDFDDEHEPVVNEDHPELTNREKWGWYLYDCANSVYSTVAISGYTPLLVIDMAKYAAYESADPCKVYIGSIGVRPAAPFGTRNFAAAMADYGGLRKRMLVGTGFAGAILTAVFALLSDFHTYWLAGLLLIVTNMLFGYSVIFYNAFLPQLVRSSKEYLTASKQERPKVLDEVGNHMSTRGFMSGYASGTFLLIATLPIVIFFKGPERPYWDCTANKDPVLITDSTDATPAYRISSLLVGIWWFGFTIFTLLWVNPRPGPPLPPGLNYVTASLKSVKETVSHIRKLPHTMVFLISYFLFSDGYSTVSSVGAMFAKKEMNVPVYVLPIMLVTVPFTALIGNYVWLWFKNKFDIPTKKMIQIIILCLLVLPTYSLIGFIDASPIGLKQTWELYVFAVWFGFNIGAIQSFTRTAYMALTPPGRESEFFGFFELTDKGSSWIGPAIVAVLEQTTGTLRYSNIWLAISFIIPFFLLRYVDLEKGTADAKNFNQIVSGKPPRKDVSPDVERELTL